MMKIHHKNAWNCQKIKAKKNKKSLSLKIERVRGAEMGRKEERKGEREEKKKEGGREEEREGE